MHPEADAFLDAIFDHPDDDTHRLVYADWLDEHGQIHYAQFIRLQCAAAREKPWSDEANRLWEEIGRVWTRLDEEWWPATRDAWEVPGVREVWDQATSGFLAQSCRRLGSLDAIHFERGFLRSSINMTSGQLVDYSTSCWPWLPLPATTLELDGGETKLLASPRISRIRSLRLLGWRGSPNYALVIAASPELVNLEVLDLTESALVEGDVDDLLRPDLFPKLREIRLHVYDSDFNTHQTEESPHHRLLRQRTEARFEKVVWLTDR